MGDREQVSVITGLGIVSPLGIGREAFWKALLSGKSGIAPLRTYDLGTYPVRIGGEVRDLDTRDYITPRKALKVMSREIQLAYVAAQLAVRDAALDMSKIDSERCGVVFGSQMLYGLPSDLVPVYKSVKERGEFSIGSWGERFPQEMFPLWMLAYLPNMPACHIAIGQQSFGPNNTIVQGNASSMLALLEADSLIQRGWTDVVFVGGTGNRLNPTRQLYTTTEYLSRSTDAPSACRPFDAHRDGSVLAEASAVLVLERESHAIARGAPILARLLGGSRTFGAPGEIFLGPDSAAIQRSIQTALKNASIASKDLRFVVAHGSGIRETDRREAAAIHAAIPKVPVTAPKSFYGDAGAGSGILDIAVAALAVGHRRLPHTLNYRTPDPECPIHVVRDEPVTIKDPIGMVLAQSDTGQAAAAILSGA